MVAPQGALTRSLLLCILCSNVMPIKPHVTPAVGVPQRFRAGRNWKWPASGRVGPQGLKNPEMPKKGDLEAEKSHLTFLVVTLDSQKACKMGGRRPA